LSEGRDRTCEVIAYDDVVEQRFERTITSNSNLNIVIGKAEKNDRFQSYLDIILCAHTPQVVQINSIPMKSLEAVKDWLDSSDIKYTQGPMNLNWLVV
jgi:nucleosome binding factor SPN SPT16 subunit